MYLRIIPNDTVAVFGIEMKKWMMPFVQLLLLSLLLHASFIGHLSGIVIGLIYVTGVPGYFPQRQVFIRSIEKNCCLEWITKRTDYISVPSSPKISAFKPSILFMSKHGASINVSDTSDDELDESYEQEEVDGLICA